MYPIRASKENVFTAAEFTEPISPESPCGESLIYAGDYDRIQDAREEDDPVLSRGVWKMPLKRADWPEVERLCADALLHRSKDLQLAVWLTEARLHLHGFRGLISGLEVTAALCREFWDGLHPGADSPDAIEYRSAPILFLNEKLPLTIKLLPLTRPASDDVKPYSWADWESATLKGARAGIPDPNAPTQALFQQSAMLTPSPYFEGLLGQVQKAMDTCQELESILEDRCGDEAPGLRQLWSVMDAIRGLLASILTQREPAPGDTAGAPTVAGSSVSNERTGDVAVAAAGPIANRADAYRRLSEAADYLSRTEPHSPTPYLVRRAIAWGSMRLEDLLPELVRNNADLTEVFRLLQIQQLPDKK